MIYTIVVFLCVVCLFLSFLLYKLYLKINIYESVVAKLYDSIVTSYNAMKQIDIRGSFESDDEVGIVFRNLRNVITDLNDTFSSEKK